MSDEEQEHPFGPNEERAIISLALENPDFFSSICHQIEPDYFQLPEARAIYQEIHDQFDQHDVIPTKGLVRDAILRKFTVDDDYEDIVALLDRAADPRESPTIKARLIEWARNRAFGMLYTEEAFERYEIGDYDSLEEIFDSAKRLTDATARGSWFFREIPTLFQEDLEEKLTCGFKPLDRFLNDGGPTRGEVVCFMAPTGVGKSIALVNSGIANYRMGFKVLHITLELSEQKTKRRYMGALTGEQIIRRQQKKSEIERKLTAQKNTYGDDLLIYEYPPDEITVDTIYALIKRLRRVERWNPDVVILDYLELMNSRKAEYNKEEYKRQKKVTTEVRGLAAQENVLVITATQTNRNPAKQGGGEDTSGGIIGLNRIAESYGKAMPIDYMISINQSPEEYNAGRVRLYIAKNRNGAYQETVRAKVDYATMTMKAEL